MTFQVIKSARVMKKAADRSRQTMLGRQGCGGDIGEKTERRLFHH